MKTTSKPIAIFKTGRHVATNGQPFDFTEADINASVQAYNPALHEAPLVIGHPAMDDPAYGWAASLAIADGVLQATARDVEPSFAELVNSRRYGKVSSAFYAPAHPANPVPGVFYLRHIGFLGAQPPAVKGLPNPSFADAGSDGLVIEFSENNFVVFEFAEGGSVSTAAEEDKAVLDKQKADQGKQAVEFAEAQSKLDAEKAELAKREAKIAADEKAAKKRELVEFAETQIKAGKLLPKDKSGCVELLMQLNDDAKLEFAEGDEQKSVGSQAWFKGFIAGLPKAIEFGETSQTEPEKTTVVGNEQAVARKAREYHAKQAAAGNAISFSEAVDAVTNGES